MVYLLSVFSSKNDLFNFNTSREVMKFLILKYIGVIQPRMRHWAAIRIAWLSWLHMCSTGYLFIFTLLCIQVQPTFSLISTVSGFCFIYLQHFLNLICIMIFWSIFVRHWSLILYTSRIVLSFSSTANWIPSHKCVLGHPFVYTWILCPCVSGGNVGEK